MKIEKKVLDMSLAGIFTAIIIAMSVVPFLGYIPLGFMNATIIHVPVIIGESSYKRPSFSLRHPKRGTAFRHPP